MTKQPTIPEYLNLILQELITLNNKIDKMNKKNANTTKAVTKAKTTTE